MNKIVEKENSYIFLQKSILMSARRCVYHSYHPVAEGNPAYPVLFDVVGECCTGICYLGGVFKRVSIEEEKAWQKKRM